MRRWLLFGVAAWSLAAVTAGPSRAEVCEEPPRQGIPTKDAASAFDRDFRHRLTMEQAGDRTAVKIVGDSVALTQESFPSLMRSVNLPRSDLARVEVDARRIILDGPLAFDHVELVLQAEEIIIGPRARIRLSDTGTSTVKIHASQLRIDAGAKRFLLFHAAKAQPNVPALTVQAAEITHSGTPLNVTSAVAYLRGATLDGVDPETQIDAVPVTVLTGQEAAKAWLTALHDRLEWPRFFAAKVAAYHAAKPFDPGWTSLLDEMSARYLDLLGDWRAPEVLLLLRSVRSMIAEQRDTLGGGPFSYPRRSLRSQLEEVEASVTGPAGRAYIESLLKLIAAPSFDQAAANAVRASLVADRDKVRQDVAALEQRFSEAVTRAAAIEQEVVPLLADIELRRAAIKESYDQAVARGDDMTWVKPVAAVVSVAAMFVATPPVAMAIATGVGLTGDLVYRHNTGGGAAGVMTLAEALPKAVEQSNKLQDSTSKTKDAWEAALKARNDFKAVQDGKTVPVKEGDKERAMTQREATKAYGQRVAAVGQAVAEIVKALDQAPAPSQLNLDSMQAADNELQAKLGQVERLRAEQKKHLATMLELEAQVQAEMIRVAQLEARYASLSNAPVENDAAREAWRAVATELWTDHFTRALRLGTTMRRSYELLTGAPLVAGEGVEDVPAMEMVYTQLAVFDPLKDPSATRQVVETKLREQADRFVTAIDGVARAVKAGAAAYQEKRFSGTLSSYVATFRDGRPKGSVEERFLFHVNALFAEAWKAAREGKAVPAQEVFVPLTYDPATQNLPEYFLAAEVSRVELDVQPDKVGAGLRFRMIHPGYGVFYRSDRCRLADFRHPEAVNQMTSITVWPIAEGGRTFSPDAVRRSVEGEEFYTYLPARAPYLLGVSVLPTPTGNAPQIQRLDIRIHYFQ